MPGRPNSFEALAAKAATRLDQARAQGEQLSLLADADPGLPSDGRVARGKGKAMSQMREFLASKGYRLPEEALAQMAGLASRDDAVMAAMVTAERVTTWAFAGQMDKGGNDLKASPAALLRAFEMAYTVQLRALDALMPYGLAKVTPDGVAQPIVNITMPAAPADAGPAMRDVTPSIPSRFLPADVAWEMQRNQQVAQPAVAGADDDTRTQEASD